MLITRHVPDGEALYQGLSATLDGTPVELPLCRVSAVPYNTPWPGRQRPLDQTEEAPFLDFESDSPVTLALRWERPVHEVLVRPLSREISVIRSGDAYEATIVLPSPGAYVVETDGPHNALHVFFNPVKDFEECTSGREQVLVYGPGVHDVGCVDLCSNTTVVLHHDAWVRGSFRAICAENVEILGFGVIDGSQQERRDDTPLFPEDFHATLPRDRTAFLRMLKERKVLDGLLRFYRCCNIKVEGPILLDSPTFAVVPAGCENVRLENVKTVGMWRYNSDGIDIFNSRDVRIEGCFLRNFDDCIVIKGIAGWDDEDVRQITVENCVFWCDWGRNLELGAETNADRFRDIVFRNIDCIHGSAVFMDVQSHNRADIGRVSFEDIRVECTRHQLQEVLQKDMEKPYQTPDTGNLPLLICLVLRNSGLFAADGKHGVIHDVAFRDVRLICDSPDVTTPQSYMGGLDDLHTVSQVAIQGVSRDGKSLSTPEELPLDLGAFVHDVTVLP